MPGGTWPGNTSEMVSNDVAIAVAVPALDTDALHGVNRRVVERGQYRGLAEEQRVLLIVRGADHHLDRTGHLQWTVWKWTERGKAGGRRELRRATERGR